MEVKDVFHANGKTWTFRTKDFQDNDVDLEDILTIHYYNLLGDLITFPVAFNRISEIKGEMDNLVRKVSEELKFLEAQKYLSYKKLLVEDVKMFSSSGKEIIKTIFPTDTAINSNVTIDSDVQGKREELMEMKKNADLIDGYYWSAKSKDQKLNAITQKVTPEELLHELIEEVINGVLMKAHKNAIN